MSDYSDDRNILNENRLPSKIVPAPIRVHDSADSLFDDRSSNGDHYNDSFSNNYSDFDHNDNDVNTSFSSQGSYNGSSNSSFYESSHFSPQPSSQNPNRSYYNPDSPDTLRGSIGKNNLYFDQPNHTPTSAIIPDDFDPSHWSSMPQQHQYSMNNYDSNFSDDYSEGYPRSLSTYSPYNAPESDMLERRKKKTELMPIYDHDEGEDEDDCLYGNQTNHDKYNNQYFDEEESYNDPYYKNHHNEDDSTGYNYGNFDESKEHSDHEQYSPDVGLKYNSNNENFFVSKLNIDVHSDSDRGSGSDNDDDSNYARDSLQDSNDDYESFKQGQNYGLNYGQTYSPSYNDNPYQNPHQNGLSNDSLLDSMSSAEMLHYNPSNEDFTVGPELASDNMDDSHTFHSTPGTDSHAQLDTHSSHDESITESIIRSHAEFDTHSHTESTTQSLSGDGNVESEPSYIEYRASQEDFNVIDPQDEDMASHHSSTSAQPLSSSHSTLSLMSNSSYKSGKSYISENSENSSITSVNASVHDENDDMFYSNPHIHDTGSITDSDFHYNPLPPPVSNNPYQDTLRLHGDQDHFDQSYDNLRGNGDGDGIIGGQGNRVVDGDGDMDAPTLSYNSQTENFTVSSLSNNDVNNTNDSLNEPTSLSPPTLIYNSDLEDFGLVYENNSVPQYKSDLYIVPNLLPEEYQHSTHDQDLVYSHTRTNKPLRQFLPTPESPSNVDRESISMTSGNDSHTSFSHYNFESPNNHEDHPLNPLPRRSFSQSPQKTEDLFGNPSHTSENDELTENEGKLSVLTYDPISEDFVVNFVEETEDNTGDKYESHITENMDEFDEDVNDVDVDDIDEKDNHYLRSVTREKNTDASIRHFDEHETDEDDFEDSYNVDDFIDDFHNESDNDSLEEDFAESQSLLEQERLEKQLLDEDKQDHQDDISHKSDFESDSMFGDELDDLMSETNVTTESGKNKENPENEVNTSRDFDSFHNYNSFNSIHDSVTNDDPDAFNDNNIYLSSSRTSRRNSYNSNSGMNQNTPSHTSSSSSLGLHTSTNSLENEKPPTPGRFDRISSMNPYQIDIGAQILNSSQSNISLPDLNQTSQSGRTTPTYKQGILNNRIRDPSQVQPLVPSFNDALTTQRMQHQKALQRGSPSKLQNNPNRTKPILSPSPHKNAGFSAHRSPTLRSPSSANYFGYKPRLGTERAHLNSTQRNFNTSGSVDTQTLRSPTGKYFEADRTRRTISSRVNKDTHGNEGPDLLDTREALITVKKENNVLTEKNKLLKVENTKLQNIITGQQKHIDMLEQDIVKTNAKKENDEKNLQDKFDTILREKEEEWEREKLDLLRQIELLTVNPPSSSENIDTDSKSSVNVSKKSKNENEEQLHVSVTLLNLISLLSSSMKRCVKKVIDNNIPVTLTSTFEPHFQTYLSDLTNPRFNTKEHPNTAGIRVGDSIIPDISLIQVPSKIADVCMKRFGPCPSNIPSWFVYAVNYTKLPSDYQIGSPSVDSMIPIVAVWGCRENSSDSELIHLTELSTSDINFSYNPDNYHSIRLCIYDGSLNFETSDSDLVATCHTLTSSLQNAKESKSPHQQILCDAKKNNFVQVFTQHQDIMKKWYFGAKKIIQEINDGVDIETICPKIVFSVKK